MSLRKAINDKCIECIYDPIGGPGTWRQQVEECTSKSCPLFPVRPLSIDSTRRREKVDSSPKICPLRLNQGHKSMEGGI
jgi:hypothetical protein